MAVGVRVHDQLRAAAQRLLAGRVHVADDHVGSESLFEQRLGPAVDRDDHGPHVADERPQRAQVALVTDAAHDDERRAIAKVGREARQLDPARQQLALLAHVLHGVAREALERLSDLTPPGLGFGTHAIEIEHLPAREELPLEQHLARDRLPRCAARRARRRPAQRFPGHHGQPVSLGQRLEQRVVGQVHEQDARFDQQLRSQVGV